VRGQLWTLRQRVITSLWTIPYGAKTRSSVVDHAILSFPATLTAQRLFLLSDQLRQLPT